jgi:hypothetical protein
MDELAIKVVMSTSMFVCPRLRISVIFVFVFFGFNDQTYGDMVDEIITDGWLMISSGIILTNILIGDYQNTYEKLVLNHSD